MATQTRSRLVLVDPTTKPKVADFAGGTRLGDLANKRLGLIDDSKMNAKEFLHEIATVLDEHFGVASVKYHRKPSSSKPATPEVIAEMAAECDYVIVGVGD